jgi:hypothetical protein
MRSGSGAALTTIHPLSSLWSKIQLSIESWVDVTRHREHRDMGRTTLKGAWESDPGHTIRRIDALTTELSPVITRCTTIAPYILR